MQNSRVMRWVALVLVLIPALAWAESGGVAIVNMTGDDSAADALGVILEQEGFEIVRADRALGGAIRRKSSVWCRKEQLEGSRCRFLANRLLPEDGRPRALPADAEDDYLIVIGEDLLDYLASQGGVSPRPRKRTFRRSGFMIGFSMGWADGRVFPRNGSTGGGNGFLSTFDIGGTIREKVALMYRTTSTSFHSTNLNSGTFAARAFLPLDFYVTTGIGIGMLSTTVGGDPSGGIGFGYLVDVGKEWPLLTHFVLGAEVTHAGQFADGGKGFITGAGAALRWYWPGRNR